MRCMRIFRSTARVKHRRKSDGYWRSRPGSLALIVKDIVREDKVWKTHEDEVLYFTFMDTAGANTTGSAYAFRNEAAQEAWFNERTGKPGRDCLRWRVRRYVYF
jgi:hypothetical protein